MLCVCELTGWNLDLWTTFAAGRRFALVLGHHCVSRTHSISPSIRTALVVVSLRVVPGCAPFRLFINLVILPLHLYWAQITKFINLAQLLHLLLATASLLCSSTIAHLKLIQYLQAFALHLLLFHFVLSLGVRPFIYLSI